jgi:hypothetical protein
MLTVLGRHMAGFVGIVTFDFEGSNARRACPTYQYRTVIQKWIAL